MANIDLLLAAVNSDASADDVQRVIASGADINGLHDTAGTALMAATLRSQATMVDTLLALGAHPDIHHATTHMTALHIAAANGSQVIIDRLLRQDADVDALDNQCWTPLMFAAQEGHSDAGRLLLSAGAAVDASDETGCSALMQAARQGRTGMAQLLLKHSADANLVADWATPLIMAALAGQLTCVQLLLDAGADIDFLQPEHGYSALMLAALQGHLPTVKLLLNRGAQVNLQTAWQVSAHTMAVRGQHPTIIDCLTAAGALPPEPVPAPTKTASGWVGDPMLVAAREG